MDRIRRALISVYDKKGIVEFAEGLAGLDIELVSTGGTAKVLKDAGLHVTMVSDVTGYPQMLDGRVKTLHPKVHAGILARRDIEGHMNQLAKYKIQPIDMVVVNLYPFEQTIAKSQTSIEDAIEQIDIGGVALIRSAAKNFKDVTAVISPAKYGLILEELKNNKGELTHHMRMRLAAEAFKCSSLYDGIIYSYLRKMTMPSTVEFPNEIALNYTKVMDLRYGENPHQKAAFYRENLSRGISAGEPRIALTKQIHGKELSFNNLLDLDGALSAIKEFFVPTAVIVKHSNPCGIACSDNLLDAYKRALSTDPQSSFGSIVVLNDDVDEKLAAELKKLFIEVLAAPAYTNSALAVLRQKKNIRILRLPELKQWRINGRPEWRDEKDIRKVLGGILLQDRDIIEDKDFKVITDREPAQEEWKGLRFAWKVVKHIKSNAVLAVRGTETIGIGAGQMSRVDAVKIVIMKAQKPLKGAVLASDAFFPFKDSVEEAYNAGITAIIQPGGSRRDKESIDAANSHNMAMVFTGKRHFRH